jgi:hypothetical protein
MDVIKITPITYFCEKCSITCKKKSDWERHILTSKHLFSRINENYECKKCNYLTSSLQDWNKHVKTKKHLIDKSSKLHECDVCNTQFQTYKSKWVHKQRCKEEPNYTDVIETLIRENNELKTTFVNEIRSLMVEQHVETNKIILELTKNNTTINSTVNNNNTNKFNINVFLNDQCKDAINFADFIKNIEISREDLENNARLGFVSGISKIFLDNLKQLGVNERPFHCTDTKRETMYIKDEDKWMKEPDDSKLQKAIQTVSYRSMGTLQEWKQENPEYQDVNSEFSEKCLDMQRNTIAGSNREVYYPKVIHVLAKETMVDK